MTFIMIWTLCDSMLTK